LAHRISIVSFREAVLKACGAATLRFVELMRDDDSVGVQGC